MSGMVFGENPRAQEQGGDGVEVNEPFSAIGGGGDYHGTVAVADRRRLRSWPIEEAGSTGELARCSHIGVVALPGLEQPSVDKCALRQGLVRPGPERCQA
jgi:hypothetical protein